MQSKIRLSRRVVPFVSISLFIGLSACGNGVHTLGVSEALTEAPACDNFRDQLWNSFYEQVQATGKLSSPLEVSSSLPSEPGHESLRAQSNNLYAHVYRSVLAGVTSSDPETQKQEILKNLAEMELGDRTTPEKQARQDQLETQLAAVSASAKASGVSCTVSSITTGTTGIDGVPIFEQFRTTKTPIIYGAYKTFAMAYQSCNMLDQAPLTATSPSVEGIAVIGSHTSGTGSVRKITSAADVFKTNPYYAGRRTPAGSCLPAQNSPLIYDYGGKPYVSSKTATELSMYKNGGSGGTPLGIDCSAFISTSIVTAGLKLKKETSNKAYLVQGVNSAMLGDPANNGLSCLAKFTVDKKNDLAVGDIIVISGHVVMVNRVGTDPFGIARAKSLSQCTTSTLSSDGFDFTLIQSSASKGGIGINRFIGKDYVAGVSSMRGGLESYAAALCKTRFGGTPPTSTSYTATIVRHKGTPECTDSRVSFEGESCMKDCTRISTNSLAASVD